MNGKFDKYLTRYGQELANKSPIAVSRPQTFPWSSTFLVPGTTVTGQIVVNGTAVHGFGDVVRNNSLLVAKTGIHSWSAKGQVVLAAPKISGLIHFIPNVPLPNFNVTPIEFSAIAVTDSAFDFVSTVNEQWKQVVYTSFEYNDTIPVFQLFLDCPFELLNDCYTQQLTTRNFIYPIVNNMKSMVSNLLSTVPF